MNRTHVLLHAISTLAPLLLFSLASIVFVTQLIAGSFSTVALALMVVSVIWIASGIWRKNRGVRAG